MKKPLRACQSGPVGYHCPVTAVVYPRSKREVDAELSLLEKHSRENRKTKESARAYLVRAGIITRSGKLAKPYRGS